MSEIHCHTCGGFITDPATVSYRAPSGTTATPHTGLCACHPAIIYGPPPGYVTSPALLQSSELRRMAARRN
ncbi:MAG TPA: hypothetical protein VEK86_00850 [Gemmatimonadales bacterium]|nr:hypothetical protein [Gemmatimonadales bacterium]